MDSLLFPSPASLAASMASLVASVPLPLPLDSLLASSWTWLALSLATIATLLRALSRIPFCRHLRPALLPPPPSIFSAETQQISSLISDLSLPLKRAHKHRISSKSTPSLQGLVHSQGHGGLAYPDLGVLMSKCLRKVVSTSDMRLIGRRRAEGVSNSTCSFICKPVTGPRLGFLVDAQEMVSRFSTLGGVESSGDRHNAACVSPQKPLLNTPSPVSNLPPCFETQFGWGELLETKLGLHWQVQRSALSSTSSVCVVKSWSIQERNLFDALHLERTSVGALDVDMAGGLACIAQTNGGLSHWDLRNQACLNRASSDVDLVSALCWKAESRFAIAGNCNVLHLWDFRTPNLMPIWNGISNSDVYENVECVDNIVCIHWFNGIFEFCDLRKSQVDCVSKATIAPPVVAMARMEAEWSLALWEKLSCDDEELWDEPVWNDASNKSSSSFTSRCVTLVRSLSSSGR